MKVSIGRAAKELGVSRSTLRRWEASGEIEVERAPNGRRRYDLAALRKMKALGGPSGRVTLAYARVSRPDQQEELASQVALLESFCTVNGWTFEVLKDVGSGVNYCNPGLRELMARICAGEVCRLVVAHRDRLLRLGAELVFSLCERFGTEVVIINASAPSSGPQDLADDVQDLVAVFSARLYGARNSTDREVMDRLREATQELAALSQRLPGFTKTRN